MSDWMQTPRPRTTTWAATARRRMSPAPDGAVQLAISCATAVKGSHPVEIGPRWEVRLPHDIDAERAIVALGGTSTCLKFATNTVPALRAWLSVVLRRRIPVVNRNSADRRALFPECPGCDKVNSGALSLLMRHARGWEHIAAVEQTDVEQLVATAIDLARAYGFAGEPPLPDDAEDQAQPWLRTPSDVHILYDYGLSLEAIEHIHAACSPNRAPLATSLYETILLKRPRLDWVATSVQAGEESSRPGDDLVEWLASTYTRLDSQVPTARADWLRTDLPRHTIEDLSEARYEAREVATLADGLHITEIGAAGTLLRWARAGCHPTPQQLLELYEFGTGYLDQHISAEMIRRIRGLMSPLHPDLDDTRLGLLFIAAGTARAAAAWIKAGVTDPIELAQLEFNNATPHDLTATESA